LTASDHPHVEAAEKYVRDVLAGRVPACHWVRQACERHRQAKRRARAKGFRYKFDKDKAERACAWIEMFPHTKGRWAAKSEPFRLEPWQAFKIASIYGWVQKGTGLRRFRRALLFVPRKNGKSDIAARIGLYQFAADGEFGAEVYSGATTEKQAWEVFRPAKRMAERTHTFRDYYGVEANASNLNILENGSRFEPVIGRPGDGSSPNCAIIDEYHEHQTDDLLETMQTGMGAREQPLLLLITTAGDNLSGPCYQMQIDAQKVLDGVVEDEQLFALVYTIDDGEEEHWDHIETIRKANPNFGVSIGEEFLIGQRDEALRDARKQAIFQTKHLNVWVGARNAYFNMQDWRRCGDPELTLADFEGERCFVGVDLASRVDIAAMRIVFPLGDNQHVSFGRYYLPEDTAWDPRNEHYLGWMRDGWLTITEGSITDFSRIEKDILELASWLQLAEVAFDPYQATYLVTRLREANINAITVPQTVAQLSEPMKDLDANIREGQVHHNGDPVMTWMMANVTAKVDGKDNVYPRKERDENKIDGPVAEIMAWSRALVDEGPQESIYEERGLRRL